MTKYQAYCKMHPEAVFEVREEYADAVQDTTDHYADAHELDVMTIEADA